MNVGDLISTIIGVIIVLYAVLSSIFGLFRPKPGEKLPDWLEDEEEEEDDEAVHPEQVKVMPPPPPPVQAVPTTKALPPEKKFTTDKFTFHAKLDDYEQKTAIDERALTIGLHAPDEIVSDAVRLEGQVYRKEKTTPIHELIKRLPEKKLLWIAHEVIYKPVALKDFPLPWNR